jgi:hypothetical protein
VLATRKQNWGEDRVMFFDEQGRLRSLLASWTDVVQADTFTQCSAGRSWLRADDLVCLCALVDEIDPGRARGVSVKKITPLL